MRAKQIKKMEASLSQEFNCKVSNFTDFSDGFSFTIPTELDAYKMAHKWQGCKRTTVSEAPNINAWLVQVYR